MIHKVSSDNPSFKTVIFEQGFNVVLAERTKESTNKDSRNGLGKTTLIEIIHFCLGRAIQPKDTLHEPAIRGWTFTLDLDLRSRRFEISRRTDQPGKVYIEGDYTDWPIRPSGRTLLESPSLPVDEWKQVLGWLMFDLPFRDSNLKYAPTFRALISYFIRLGHDAFSTPFTQNRNQVEWDKQANIAFLLNLNWEHASRWQLLRDQERLLRDLRQASNLGLIEEFVGSIGELESRLVTLRERSEQEAAALSSFLVHPQYAQIEADATALTTGIHRLTNENVSDRRMLEFYQAALQSDHVPDTDKLSRMYAEAGLLFPDRVTRRLSDVQNFHQQVVESRRNFLDSEINRLRSLISERSAEVQELTQRRAALMRILETHRALEEYTELQRRHLELLGQMQELEARIQDLKRLEGARTQLRLEKLQLERDARIDYEDRRPLRERAISLFNSNSQALYEAPGRLIVDIKDTGFKFEVEIERARSEGVGKMKIFCFDLMLAQLWAERPANPGFLVHDSTMFDGVDERQVAHALELAAVEAERRGFQYICCLNSDTVPQGEFSQSFDLNNYVRLILTDASESGGLLGIRF